MESPSAKAGTMLVARSAVRPQILRTPSVRRGRVTVMTMLGVLGTLYAEQTIAGNIWKMHHLRMIAALHQVLCEMFSF